MRLNISIIIVTYNASSIIDKCLYALQGQTNLAFEVILVDNCSEDNTIEIVEAIRPSLTYPINLLQLDENRGFAGGNIEGLNHADTHFIALLNPDTEPDVRWIETLVTEMNKRPDVGICASKLIVHGSDVIDSAGDGFSTLLKGYKRGEGMSVSTYDREEYIFGACAGAALYRRSMIDETGFLDTDFFLTHEDTDLNFRAQLAGWKVMYVPEAIVYHKVSSSIGHMSDIAIYHTIRNSGLVRIKNVPLMLFVKCLPAFILGMVSEFFYFVIKHKRPLLYVKAKLDALGMLPLMLRKRRAIMSARRVRSSELTQIMTSAFDKSFFKNKLRKMFHG